MRLIHLVFAIAALSVMMTLARDPLTRVFLIIFLTGLGEVVFATTALLALFQTVGALGEAKGFSARVEAVAATSAVIAVATAVMSAWLFFGAWFVATTT